MARFTPGQLREALGLTKETLRYWKKEFPTFEPVKGARACFGPADLLAASIIKKLTELGLPVRRIAPLVSSIHTECKHTGWFALERQIMTVHLESGEVRFAADARVLHSEPTLSVPLAPLITALRAHLLQDDLHVEQRSLAFGPMPVAGASSS